MKKLVMSLLLIGVVALSGCENQKTETNATETVILTEHNEPDILSTEETTTISGSFTVSVRDVIPDYCLDGSTPNTAVVTEFQSYPFTVYVGEEIGSQLEIDKVYVFTIDPVVAEYPKEYWGSLELSSLVNELPGFMITDFRLANEDEMGLESLRLTIE